MGGVGYQLFEDISLPGTFPEVLVQTVYQSQSGTFRFLGILLVKLFFQFSFVTRHFRCLQMIIKQADRATGYFDVTPQAAILRVRIGDKTLFPDRITAENSQLQKLLSFGSGRNILIRPVRKSGTYTVNVK